MTYRSHDPRMNRIDLPVGSKEEHREDELDQWQTYEVFSQQKRGDQHVHVGSLHAPNAEMALVLAKEQYGRREQCANLWVVKSGDITATDYEDADMFQHAFDKTYREGEGYKVRDTIETFKRDLEERLRGETGAPAPASVEPAASVQQLDGDWKAYELPDLGRGPRKVLVKR